MSWREPLAETRQFARQPSADDAYSYVYGTVHAAFSYTFARAISILDLE